MNTPDRADARRRVDRRVTRTLIVNPSNGSTAVSTFVLPATSAAWILGAWDKRSVTFRGETAVTEACFDGSLLKRQRAWASIAGSGSRTSADLLTAYSHDAAKQVPDTSLGTACTQTPKSRNFAERSGHGKIGSPLARSPPPGGPSFPIPAFYFYSFGDSS